MKKKKYPKEFKARVALEVVKGEKSIAQISSEFGVHSNMVSKWKEKLKDNIADIFVRKNEQEPDAELFSPFMQKSKIPLRISSLAPIPPLSNLLASLKNIRSAL